MWSRRTPCFSPVGLRWAFDAFGDVSVGALSRPEASAIDAAWMRSRLADDQHTFEWSAIRAHPKRCTFKLEQVVGGNRSVMAAFAVYRKLRRLPIVGDVLRLDFFEVHPNLRAQGYGRLAFAMIATMALDQRAKAIVLAASRLPAKKSPLDFYVHLGGIAAKTVGWRGPRGETDLVPTRFDSATLVGLQGEIDAYRQR